jgi:hypothetical protein
MKSIVMLSGPVGSGKTTVARKLVESISGPVVYIEGDLFWSFFVRSEKTQSRFKNFKTILVSMLAASLPYASDGFTVIFDFSIPPWFLESAKKIAKVRDLPLDYIIIRPDEKVCAARAASRIEGAISDYTPYHDLFVDFDKGQPYIVGNDHSEPNEIVNLILKGLEAGKFRLK